MRKGRYSMPLSPVVSVIIPAFNCAHFLRRAVDSALLQERETAVEVLVINDCSTDDTEQVILHYRDNPAVRYVKNERNLGASGSRNLGVSLARGKYVAFLDADDWWESGKLGKQLARMEETGAVLCSTARELVDEDGNSLGKVIHVPERITYRMMLHQNRINCSAALVLREVMARFPMEHEDSHEDYIAWMRILKEYGFACGIDEPLLKYTLSKKGKSGSKWKSARMTFSAYRYMGFDLAHSVWYFLCYAVNGLWKYR